MLLGKAKKSVRLMMDKLFEMKLELILASTIVAKTINGEAQIHARVDGKKVIFFEASIRRDLQFADEGVDYLPNSTIFEQLASMGCQEAMRDTIVQSRFENVSTHSNDSLLARGGEDVFVEQEAVADKEKIDKVTLAQALAELETSNPKAKRVVIQEPKPVKLKKKDQIRLDKETALKLQAKFDEEEQRLARERAKKEQEANIALIETWDDVQAKIDADHQLAERLQAEEQQELTDEEKATLFMQF
nr:hypothetical protein [Tanacetum cinerariifolium]